MNTLKRDYVRVTPMPDAQAVLDLAGGWIEECNENHPHSGLKMRSPREFIASTIYAVLVVAIAAEIIATAALARSESFTQLGPSLITVVGYAVAVYFLSLALRVMPTGVVYAVWSGMGIVFITAIGWVWFGERLYLPAIVGLGLSFAGVAVVNVFSVSMPH